MKPLIDNTGEVRELTQEDLVQFKSAQNVLPKSLIAKLKIENVSKTSKALSIL